MAVRFEHISKTYPGARAPVQALSDVSFEIERGEFFGLLGPNGAGKTTLIAILAGLNRATSGKVSVLGHDVVADYAAARKALGIVPQELVFDPFFSVRETLRIQSGYFGIRDNDGWIDEILHHLDLTGKANANMRSLSGGMKRRVLVGQALWSFVRGLNEAGHTIVLTTHYLEEAQQLCARIAMMKEGRIVALDSTARLLAAFSQRVLRVKLARGALPETLAEGAALDAAGWWRIPIADMAHVERSLARLREAGAAIESLEVAEPELEQVFVKIMNLDAAGLAGAAPVPFPP